VWRVGTDPDAPWVLSPAPGTRISRASPSTPTSHDHRARRGIAAFAITAPGVALTPGQTAFTLGSGFYRDAAAISASFTHRFNSTMPLYFSAGYSNGGGTEHVGRAAVTFVW